MLPRRAGAAVLARGRPAEPRRSPDAPRPRADPGDVDREHGRFLNDVETYRRRVDYGSGGVERDTEELLAQTSTFLEAMREHVEIDLNDDGG